MHLSCTPEPRRDSPIVADMTTHSIMHQEDSKVPELLETAHSSFEEFLDEDEDIESATVKRREHQLHSIGDEYNDNDAPYPHTPGDNRRSYHNSTLVKATAAAAAAAAAVATSALHSSETKNDSPARKHSNAAQSPRSPDSVITARTVETDGSRSPDCNVVTVEHRVKQSGSSNKVKLAKLKKPAVALLFLLLSGSAAYLFSQWLTIPGLNDQIERLTTQVDELEKQVDRLEAEVDRLSVEVDRLDSEVDRLSDENDRFAQLNEELEANNAEYVAQNEILRNTTELYGELNTQLNASNVELERLNGELQAQNEDYLGLNVQLNSTVRSLTEEVEVLQNVTLNLTETNIVLRQSVVLLTDRVEILKSENEFLNNTVFSLNQDVESLANETERLAELNANLGSIVSFLNETAAGMDESYNAISEFLAEQITAYRGYVLDTLKNLYMQRVTNWDCDFRSFFLTQPFVRDPSTPIGSEAYPKVRDYIEERILSELCLDTSDFEQFLKAEYAPDGQRLPVNVTTNQLKRTVQVYTRDALDHYFPNTSDPQGKGPNDADWAAADYNCENLPTVKKFLARS